MSLRSSLLIPAFLCAVLLPLPAQGQGTFQRNDQFYDDHSIHINTLNPDHFGALVFGMNHPGGRSPFQHIVRPPYAIYAPWATYEMKLDMDGDDNNDIDLLMQNNPITTGSFQYPTPTHWADKYTAHLTFAFKHTVEFSIITKTATFPIYVTVPQRIYADASGNALVQMRDETCTNKLPVIVVEGWDAINTTFPWEYAYNFKTVLDSIYSNNGEVFVLDFADAGASMLSNADVVLDALGQVHALCPNQNVALIGFSMGGVIAKHALAKAERQGIQHHVGLFVSYDAPHFGANSNLSLQTQMALTSSCCR